MHPLRPILAACAAIAVATPAAAQTASFDIPAGRLSDALNMLAAQAGITVGASDPALSGIRSKPVRGRMSARAALERLLAGTGFSFRFVTPGTVRIVRAATPRPAFARAPSPPPRQPVPDTAGADILVTASKQGVPLDRYTGAVQLVDVAPEEVGRFGTRGSDAILERLPMLSSTSLGPGRNKIFIRGVADSSFNGPSQSIVGQYLGDVRLTFNAPDPDLQLYDVKRVEVLEGPQGTLYGSGALGGIMRIVPNDPDTAGASGNLMGSVLATEHGGVGRDLSATVNLPLVTDRLAVRVVAYGSRDAGYIDDTGRNLRDVNSVGTHGGRINLQWLPGNDWRLEVGGAVQFIAGKDGQYALKGAPPLSRSSSLAQPFDNDYRLAQFTVAKSWPSLELVSATEWVNHDLETQFDATGRAGTTGPQVFIEDARIRLIANETRLSQSGPGGLGWLAGWSILHDTNNISRRLGPSDAPLPIAGVRNEITEAALFGQYSVSVSDSLTATLGGRLTYSRSVGMLLDTEDEAEEPHRTDVLVSPTLAASWRPDPSLTIYGSFKKGFRAGGLAISAVGSTTATQRFASDSLSAFEAGMRWSGDRFSLNTTLSYTRWGDMQADLIDDEGLPYTTNLGDGRIYGVELGARWQPDAGLRFEAAAFINESSLAKPAPPFAAAEEHDLPNIALAGGRLAAHYEVALGPSLDLSMDGSLRYVGASRLGIGEPIDIRQGDYFDSQLGTRLDFGSFGVSLDIDNLTDTRGNRFSFGNPFTVGEGNQVTPLRPRTVRLGLDAAF